MPGDRRSFTNVLRLIARLAFGWGREGWMVRLVGDRMLSGPGARPAAATPARLPAGPGAPRRRPGAGARPGRRWWCAGTGPAAVPRAPAAPEGGRPPGPAAGSARPG